MWNIFKMEANVFISRLKADGSQNDFADLDAVFKEYKTILSQLSSKDRGSFALNVICILCRNLEKIPTWRRAIDNKRLVALSVECAYETRTLNQPEQVKALACIYHIHRHVVRETNLPPEDVMKLSYIPFENTPLLTEYCKTYWNILADRITYIEKLKTKNVNILKLLPKLTEDVLKVISIYNTVQFISMILTFLIKKLHFLYSDIAAKELNKIFGNIFEEIQSKNDLRGFKKLALKDTFDIYMKLNDCLYVIAENSSKINFEGTSLNTVVKTCISIIEHESDLLYCLQNIYLNGFCTIFDKNQNCTYIETVLTNFVTTCENIERLGYKKAINATYPYINQYLRIYIESNVANKDKITEPQQIACLSLMEFLLKKLKNCDQISKCENCKAKSGLHDALRLSFLVKTLITSPLQEKKCITKMLPIYFSIVLTQYEILKELCKLGCANYEKCYRKLQSDVHNTAILLNKSQNYDYSIKLFEIYLRNEILHFKSENDMKNISRALYNKSICELDFKQYEIALIDAYLSLIFAYPDGMSTEKYMSLAMDIKAKSLKSKDGEEQDSDIDDLQTMTVLDACATAIERKMYGSLKPFFCNLKFSALLKHEFNMYAKLWPSIVPIAGVWRTLHDLTQHDVPWINVTDESTQQILFDIILETPMVVRTIHNDHYSDIISELLQRFEEVPPRSVDLKMVQATMMVLKAELDLADATVKFGWKAAEPSLDPDQAEVTRTLPQEHGATKQATRAVHLWTDIIKHIDTVPITPAVRCALHAAQVCVPLLLHLYEIAHGLQLAHICCRIAEYIGDKISYITNAGTIIYHANRQTSNIATIISTGTEYCTQIMNSSEDIEAALVFLSDCAIYYTKINSIGLAAKLTQVVQAKILHIHSTNPAIKLDIAVGRLLEAQVGLCRLSGSNGSSGLSGLSGVIGAHRHYLATGNNATKWTSRRLRGLYLKLHIQYTGLASTAYSRRLLLWRRARSSCGATLPAAGACAQAELFALITNHCHADDARVKIDNRLKHILGVRPSLDQPIAQTLEPKSHQLFTPKQELETMLENMTFKKTQVSPTYCIDSIPGFQYPEFLKHDLNCTCYACQNLFSVILACKTASLEAAMYFMAKEYEIAKNYFDGALKCLKLAENKLKSVKNTKDFEIYVVEIVEKILNDDFCEVQIETLIEAAFFELSQADYKRADEHIIAIHEILQENENVDRYLKNEVLNLLTTSAHLRKLTNKKDKDYNLEADFENLKLSPAKQTDAPKTPEAKAEKPPKITKIKVKDEEVPNTKRRIIKLNLDEKSFDEKDSNTKETGARRKATKRTDFKIPVPVTTKPVLESITPTPRRKKPEVLITQPSKDEPSTSIFEFATPKPKNADKTVFLTPMGTPNDQFFTPMSTLKTYSKKSLRHGIVKNLESEFSTPKSEKMKTDESDESVDALKGKKSSLALQKAKEVKTESEAANASKNNKENQKSNLELPKSKTKKVESGCLKTLKDKRSLKRATSPGPLDQVIKPTNMEKAAIKPTRSARLRKPVKLSLEDDAM